MHLPISITDLLNKSIIETDRIEFKADFNPEPILRTICAFANDFHNYGGGYIVVGIEENNGKPVLPPKGINIDSADRLQKEILNISAYLKPTYTPIVGIEKFQDKDILVIWVPGGATRPYSAPATLGKDKEYKYYIRKLSSTVITKNDELKELISLTATVPFDDRINHRATVEDIKLPLIQSFLKEIGSELLEESRSMPLTDLCRQMAIVDGGDEYLKPRNIALLFFNDEPGKFFPYIQIDVVHFPDDEGGDIIQEAIFKGPLDHQLTTALRHIKNNFIIERVLKIPGQAEAKRFFNYPYEAIEEALVNAVYHRSYEIREPIEVRINRTSISVVSHPGPDPSISTEDIKAGRMISRRYRNRRIGEFLKELDFTEGRGTGVPKMRRSLQNNGSNNPVFFTDNERASFWVEIKIHPAFLEEHVPTKTHVGVHDEVHDRVYDLTQTGLKIINIINNQSVNSSQIVTILGYKTLTRNIKAALRTLLEKGLIAYTIPDKPRSKRQRYTITSLGKNIIERQAK